MRLPAPMPSNSLCAKTRHCTASERNFNRAAPALHFMQGAAIVLRTVRCAWRSAANRRTTVKIRSIVAVLAGITCTLPLLAARDAAAQACPEKNLFYWQAFPAEIGRAHV